MSECRASQNDGYKADLSCDLKRPPKLTDLKRVIVVTAVLVVMIVVVVVVVLVMILGMNSFVWEILVSFSYISFNPSK